MKIILVAALINCCVLFQQDEPLSKVANVELPQKSLRMNKASLPAKAKGRFKSTLAISKYEHVYEVDNVLLAFADYNEAKDDFKGLEDRKTEWLGGMSELGLKANVDKAEIIKVNNTRFLIMGLKNGDEYYCSFISDKKGSRGISGSIQYKAEDKDKAEKILSDFLKRISFKAPSLSRDN
ncbi:hypothetical protein [Pedobacter borealis]|uniref:hypothetical protein n=1 Tax=Pedobacter borealis TaxID=475254 RepID=UPI0004933CA9|nr:hypothetical protein [Pedobacter borealis]